MPRSRLLNIILPIAIAAAFCGGMFGLAISSETPVGSLKGRSVALESGAPLKAQVQLTAVTNKEDDFNYHYVEASDDGYFSFARVPAGDYTLEMRSKAHTLKPVRITITEGKTTKIDAELAPNSPNIDLYIHQHIFTPDERAQVTAMGFVDSDAVDVRLYKVDLDSFLLQSNGSMERLLGIESYYDNAGSDSSLDLDSNKSLSLVDSFRVPITSRDAEGVFTRRIDFPQLGQGLYVAEVKAGGVSKVGWIMITSLGLVTKTAGRHTLAYTVDLKTGDPVSGADVTVYADESKVASGKTDSHGLAELTIPTSIRAYSQTIIARSGESFAFASSDLSSAPQSDMVVYAYTDRPVYRPGQMVYYKEIIRSPHGGNYTVPVSMPVTVEVRDSNDTLIYRATKTTTRFGSISGHIPLSSEAATGSYNITTTINGAAIGDGTTFQVAAYRKPEFNAKVTFPEKRYIRGDNVHATIAAAYYFGAPVANARVHYIVRMSPYWIFGDDEESDAQGAGYADYSDGGEYGEVVNEGDIRTDENGEASIDFPAAWPQPAKDDAADSDQQFSVEITVTDKSDREATGSTSVVATRGEFALDVMPDSYIVAPGSSTNVAIQAMDYDKHPVADKDLLVTLNRREYSDEGEVVMQELQKMEVTTDKWGRASTRVPVKEAGSLVLMARTTDSRGNAIVGSNYIWSYSGNLSDTQGESFPDLQIVTDKKTYNPGDTAKVLINTRNPGATALVTVEGDRIYDSRTVLLKGKSTMVEIPVRDEYKPNFYVGVCYVRNKSFANQHARAKVSMNAQALRVSINPDRRRYHPGDKAQYKIKVTDQRGRPVSAELSLGIVDEAIYAIAEESTPRMLDSFYSKKRNQVNTNFSFPQIYLSDPDKAGPPLVDSPQRRVRVRKKFLDTAYWDSSLITDANGEAVASLDLPDNLTTWRATVRCVTLDTACGENTHKVLAQQDLLVRLEMPRFMVQGDNSTISAIVHNYTGSNQDVTVDLRAPGLDVDGRMERTVSIKNGGSERLDWDVTAPRSGSFLITARAITPKAADAVQLSLPVQPHGVRRETVTAGVLTGSRLANVKLRIRTDSIPEATRLKLRFAPSIASAMLGSLQYLAEYPYGCTEQTTSAFIPDVILSRALKDLGIHNPKLEAELPDMVSRGLLKLYRFQLDDGGWSWCEYGKSDPEMTAYVCYALLRARGAGFTINEDVLSRGLNRLRQHLEKLKMHLDTRVYACYVLALAGNDVTSDISKIAARRKLSSMSLAFMTLAYTRLGHDDMAKTTLSRLYKQAIVDASGIHWAGYDDYRSSAVETTAYALSAALAASPNDSRTYEIVRWLMSKRGDDAWVSTRDTAAVVFAMSGFLKATHELNPDYEVIVMQNGKIIGRMRFDKSSVFAPEWELEVPARNLRSGVNNLEIHKTGPGNLYYSTKLVQYLKKDHIYASVTGAGLSITRTYYKPSSEYYSNSLPQFLGSPVSSCYPTETVLVRLVVTSTEPLSRLLLEDYIPAGFEIVDKGNVSYWEWDNWYIGRDIRDDRISFYVDNLQPGRYSVDYQMRAGYIGSYTALPAQVFSMYEPGIRASTEETEFTVR